MVVHGGGESVCQDEVWTGGRDAFTRSTAPGINGTYKGRAEVEERVYPGFGYSVNRDEIEAVMGLLEQLTAADRA